jgi:hypothetical protein
VCSGLEIVAEPDLMQTFMDVVDSDSAAVRNNASCVKLLERTQQD